MGVEQVRGVSFARLMMSGSHQAKKEDKLGLLVCCVLWDEGKAQKQNKSTFVCIKSFKI